MLMDGAFLKLVVVAVVGRLVEQLFVVDAFEVFDESSCWTSASTPSTIATRTMAMPALRAVRMVRRRCSAFFIASRRSSRLMRWRSRLVALGTAGDLRGPVYERRTGG